jgi:hypothetical protein
VAKQSDSTKTKKRDPEVEAFANRLVDTTAAPYRRASRELDRSRQANHPLHEDPNSVFVPGSGKRIKGFDYKKK